MAATIFRLVHSTNFLETEAGGGGGTKLAYKGVTKTPGKTEGSRPGGMCRQTVNNDFQGGFLGHKGNNRRSFLWGRLP